MVSFPTERMVYRFGGFTLDPASETLRAADGVPVALRAKSLALLELLVENAGHLLTREAIMDALWPNIFVTDDSITQCVRDIRSVLGRNSTAMLRTVRRRGYVFDAGAVRQDREQKAVTSADRPQSLGVSGPGIDRPVRLLVLPVHQWKSDDSDADKPLSRTVTEAIVADLVPLLLNLTSGEVQVLFRDDRLTHQQSAWQHDRPDYVLRGSIHDVYRTSLSLQLIDTSSWACIWAEQDQSCWAGNVLSRLVRGVAIALIRYIGSQMDAIPIQELSLHELLLRGNFHLLRPASRVSRRQALTCFEQALSKDQGSTAARLGIARAIVCSLTNSLSDDIAADEARSETLLLEVLQSSGDSGVAHTALGTLRRLQGRLEEAQVALEWASVLTPRSGMTASQIGMTLLYRGKPEAALPWFERAIRMAPLDPQAPVLRGNLGIGLLMSGNLQGAEERLREASAGNPHNSAPPLSLAATLGLKARSAEAAIALRRAVGLCPELATLSSLRTWVRRQASADFMPIYEQTVERGLMQAGMREE